MARVVVLEADRTGKSSKSTQWRDHQSLCGDPHLLLHVNWCIFVSVMQLQIMLRYPQAIQSVATLLTILS